MYLNTYGIVFLAVTASGLIALGIYDYTKARSKNFVNTFQKHYQNKISGYQEEERFFSPKTSTPGKRQGLSIVLTYFLTFCIGTFPFWMHIPLFTRQDPFERLSEDLFIYFISLSFMAGSNRLLKNNSYRHRHSSQAPFFSSSSTSPFCSTTHHNSIGNIHDGFGYSGEQQINIMNNNGNPDFPAIWNE